ncbi:MAG: glycoside hydrolase family 18 protein [Spirochaetota bacterium]
MKRQIIFILVGWLYCNISLTAYENTVYLPYYRLPRIHTAAQEPSSPFDFSKYDPELRIPYRETYSRSGIQPFQEYLIAALASGRVTQINYFRVLPAPKGDLDRSGFYETHMAYLQKLRRAYGFRLGLCVAGASSRFLPALKNAELRQRLAQNLIALAQTWQLDAVDFDWEYPRNKKDMDAYIALISAVREGVRKRRRGKDNFRVSVAISRRQAALSTELFQAVDMVNFMGYDFAPRHSTMEDITEMVDYLSVRYVIPPKKIFLGMPFYGKEMKNGRRKARTYQSLSEDFDLKPQDNEVDNYYFNGQSMIAQKFAFAQEKGLGGTMIWEIGQDSKDHRSLLKMFPRQ